MQQMSSRQRFLAALAREPVDRVPVANPTSIVTTQLQEEIGIFFPDAHRKAEQMAELALRAQEQTGFDIVFPIFAGGTHEAEALGVPVRWGDRGHMPACETSIWEKANDIVVPDDFIDRPSIRVTLDAISIIKREVGDSIGIIGKVYGPWSLAYHCFGLSRFLKSTIKDPGEVDAILERLMEPCILYAQAQIEAGADALCWGAHITGDLIRPEAYPKHLCSIDKRIVNSINAPLIFHCCGKTLDRAEYFNESKMTAFHFESQNDPFEMRKKSDMVLIGNINNPVTLLGGKREDIRREVFHALDAGIDIIAPECAIPLNAHIESIKIIRDCVDEYFAI